MFSFFYTFYNKRLAWDLFNRGSAGDTPSPPINQDLLDNDSVVLLDNDGTILID